MDTVAYVHSLNVAVWIGVALGMITSFFLLYQIPRNKSLNRWFRKNLGRLFRSICLIVAIPVVACLFAVVPPVAVALIFAMAFVSPVLLVVVALAADGVPPYRRKLDVQKAVSELQEKYPGKKIICVPEKNPTEVICEVERTDEYSKIVAVTQSSEKHFHRNTTEIYHVLRGTLAVYTSSEGKINRAVLKEGQTALVSPGFIQWAEGIDEDVDTWIEAECTPPWSPDDHFVCAAASK